MALSLGARKMLTEAAGLAAVLVIGAAALTHRHQIQSALGLPTPHAAGTIAGSAAAASKPADDGIVRSGRGRSVELTAGTYGHFYTEADVNGRAVSVVVDTGASMVALTYDDARRAGFSLRDSDFTGRTSTANGIAKVAPVMIDRITIGDIEVRNVKGVVAEYGALSQTLLGMTFLGRLSVSMKADRLVLEE